VEKGDIFFYFTAEEHRVEKQKSASSRGANNSMWLYAKIHNP